MLTHNMRETDIVPTTLLEAYPFIVRLRFSVARKRVFHYEVETFFVDSSLLVVHRANLEVLFVALIPFCNSVKIRQRRNG